MTLSKQKDLLNALNYIEPNLPYDEWIKVGTALKTEGLDFEVWNEWSAKATEVYPGPSNCLSHWNSFKEGTVNGGTILHLAQQNGYQPKGTYSSEQRQDNFVEEQENKSKKEEMTEEQKEERRKFLEQCENNLDSITAVQDYLFCRGITLTTAHKYHLGAGSNGMDYTLVIPNDNGSYTERYLEPLQNGQRYRKTGNGLFNASVLNDGDVRTPIFVTEGQIDALSIIERGYKAMALTSTTNINMFLEAIKDRNTAPLILCMDNDKTGKKATEKLLSTLKTMETAVFNIPGKYNDINEYYLCNQKSFDKDLEETFNEHYTMTYEEEVKHYANKETNESVLEDLFSDDYKDFGEPVSTGFKALDKAIEGGLYGELYTIGAGSGEGKTAISLQIMDNIASSGQDVLIFSLEMSKTELVARSLSRLTYDISTSINSVNSTAYAKTELGISSRSRYKHYSQQELDVINQAKERYKQYAKNIHVVEGVGNISINEIKEAIKRHIGLTGNIPVVLIDYLQLIAPSDIRLSDKQSIDKNILELKRITRDYDVPILLISSLNRESYKNGTANISLASFKESGAIEYTSTVVLSLECKEQKEKYKEIQLTILKNRKGKNNQSFSFRYYPAFQKFEEIESYTPKVKTKTF